MKSRSAVYAFVLFSSGGICGYLIDSVISPNHLAEPARLSEREVKLHPTYNPTDLSVKKIDAVTSSPFAVIENVADVQQLSPPEQSDRSPQPVAYKASAQSKPVTVNEMSNKLNSVSNWSEPVTLSLEEVSKRETELLQALEHSPELVKPLLTAYAQMSENAEKQLLRSLLAARGTLEVEQHALTNLTASDSDNQDQWLYLLAPVSNRRRSLGLSNAFRK